MEVKEEVMMEQQKPTLTPSSVTKIMKSITPSNHKISSGAKEFMYDCAVKFVEVVFSQAKEISRQKGHNVLTGDHIVEALGNVGLSDHYGYFSVFLQLYQRSEKNHKAKANASAPIVEQQPRGSEQVEEYGLNPDPGSSLVYQENHAQFPPLIPSQFLFPPIEMQETHVPLVDLGIPIPALPYVHNPQLALGVNNPGPLQLLGELAQPAPPQMGPFDQHYADNIVWPVHVDQAYPLQEPEEISGLMYEGDDGASTSGTSEAE